MLESRFWRSSQFQVYPAEYLDSILDYVLPSPDSIGRIGEDRNILIYGSKGSGKSVAWRQLGDAVKRRYGTRNVNVASSKYTIEPLFTGEKIKPKLVQVLVADDITKRQQSPEAIAKFFDIRHIVERTTGIRNGLIITVPVVHRFTSTEPELRENIDLIFAKSVPTRSWGMADISRKVMDQFFGSKLLDEFDCLKRTAEPPELSKALTAFSNPSGRWAGIMYFPIVPQMEPPEVGVEPEPEPAVAELEREFIPDTKTVKRFLKLIDSGYHKPKELAYELRGDNDTGKRAMKHFLTYTCNVLDWMRQQGLITEEGWFSKGLYVTEEGYIYLQTRAREQYV